MSDAIQKAAARGPHRRVVVELLHRAGAKVADDVLRDVLGIRSTRSTRSTRDTRPHTP